MDFLVSTDWLARHLNGDDLVVIDCTNFSEFDRDGDEFRTISCRPQWSKEHIEGARYADFSGKFSGLNNEYRNALPSPQNLATALGGLGVGSDTRVVLYDTMQSMWAARLWWMLRWIGFDNAAILDGGLSKWKADGKATSSTTTPFQSKNVTPQLRPNMFVSKDDVFNALKSDDVLIIDALSEGQFQGRQSDLGICGHIPGSVNIPAEGLIDPKTGTFLNIDELAKRLPKNTSQQVIVYCGSGIAAASVAFTLTRLGFEDVSIYMPGLQEWLRDENAPVNNRANALTREIST